MCRWVHLPDKQNPNQRLCGRPGHPFCGEHQAEMNYIRSLDNDWKEGEATRKGTRAFQAERLQRDAGRLLSEPAS
jgi:hypothetical protein